MNTLRRSMFANGDEAINVDRLIQYYTAQGYSPVEIDKLIKQQFPSIQTADVYDKMLATKELFPVDAERMPPPEISQEVKSGLEPNQIQFSDGRTQDFDVAINRIRNNDIRLENVFALYNTPGIKLGSDVKRVVEDYIKKEQPDFLKSRELNLGSGQGKILGDEIPIDQLRGEKFGKGIASLDDYSASDAFNVPTSYQFLGKQILGSLGEGGREGLERLGDLVGGESVGDIFRGDFMGGDPDMFLRSGGRNIEDVINMAIDMNNPEQPRTGFGFIGDTITDALNNLDVDTSKFSGFFSKDPILEIDTVQRKKFEDAQEGTIQENLNNVSEEAGDGADPEIETTEVLVTEVEGGGQDDAPGDGDGDAKEEQEGVKPDITDGDAPKRTFAQFTRSPDFLRFVRNIGKGLVTTGQIGQGIALGSAGAAEEKYAEEVAASAAYNELLKEEIKQRGEGGLKPPELQALNKNVSEMSKTIQEFEGSEASIEIMDNLIGLFENARITGGKVSGIGGQFNIYADKLKAALGYDFDSSDATKIAQAINQVKQRSIREILNESGRTISDLDRQIVDKIFGEIDLTTPPDQLSIKLRKARADLVKNNTDKQRKIGVTYKTVLDPIYGVRGKNLIIDFEPTIQRILNAKAGDNYTLTPISSNLYPNSIFIDTTK